METMEEKMIDSRSFTISSSLMEEEMQYLTRNMYFQLQEIRLSNDSAKSKPWVVDLRCEVSKLSLCATLD